MRNLEIGLVILALFILFFPLSFKNFRSTSQPKLVETGKIRNITVEAEGSLLHYREETFWNDSEFLKISKNKEEFKTEQIKRLNDDLKHGGFSNEYADNFNFEFNDFSKSTVITCDIHNAFSGDTAEFRWLLRELPVNDLFKFEMKEKELDWSGEVNGIQTSVKLIFPYTINHCLEHVWPKR